MAIIIFGRDGTEGLDPYPIELIFDGEKDDTTDLAIIRGALARIEKRSQGRSLVKVSRWYPVLSGEECQLGVQLYCFDEPPFGDNPPDLMRITGINHYHNRLTPERRNKMYEKRLSPP